MHQGDFPSAAAVLPYMSHSESYVVRTTDGLSKHSEGPPVVGSVPTMLPMTVLSTFGVRSAPVVVEDVAVEAVEEVQEAEEALAP